MSETDIITRLMLSFQRALIGAVTPNIRHVYFRLLDKKFTAYFVFDGAISDDDCDNTGVVGGEIAADFSDMPGLMFDEVCIRLDQPNPLEFHVDAVSVYSRKEPPTGFPRWVTRAR